ncbi:flagellar hook-associated protein FlgL [Variovorax sp. NFACC27]|uniref:flagellar hook-associated protein FlgL n=1 Tax=unclassified Variovorax TaxID=663243 RepID=UPI0008984214|nr:flagellar hook-associated protein FlgL [Variovorax sp. YR750]MDP9604086.1 flagellar hook-associated protein 3 FlgL [Variovorax paradoxus]SEF26897.1 flagellar hook-associated protein 3 FlgL [Variovorax sp. NFACC28]SEG62046.1 flagellar hook-associated protein 3 FlgL [Variovorax sp. NFACC29]SFC62895.1 flagellar hook-associated protein 3 FlgL [Variovorax sp. NFACC26]SFG68928.1 flagellar hook-associated protein 3 FlgL [Variovorax sp. NFACC27]
MRISTQSFYDQNVLAMGQQQQKLFKVQQQLATNSKFLSAGDDPVGAARALGVSQTLSEISQYATSRQRASLSLSNEENALDSVTSILQNIKTLTVQAGGAALSDADRASIATAIQSSYDQLVGIANSTDSNGQYLFAGFKSGTPPFVAAAGGSLQYVGDQGQRLMQVDVARQMPTSDDGRTVFQSVQGSAGYVASGAPANTGTGVFGSVSVTDATAPNYGKDFTISFTATDYTVMTKDTPPVVAATGTFSPDTPISFGGVQVKITGKPAAGDSFDVSTAKNAGTDVFAAIGELVSALRTPLTGGGAAAQAKLQNALSTANVKVTNAHDNVLTVLSSVGSRQAEIDSLDSGGADRKLQEESYLSSIEDLDPYTAISEFYQRQSSLQATQMTFARLNSISLFNYL